MLHKRIPLGLAMIAALTALIYLDAKLSTSGSLAEGCVLAAMVGVLSGWAAWEFCVLARACGHRPSTPTVVTMTVLSATCPWWGRHVGGSPDVLTSGVLAIAVVVALLARMRRAGTEGAMGDLATAIYGVVYLGVLSSFLVRLRMDQGEWGAWWILAIVGIVKLSDIGAFFAGKYLGKRKLVPHLSPGKTWAGLIGAILSATAASLALALSGPTIGIIETGGSWVESGRIVMLGPILAVIGQFGDLSESILKRSAGAKDSADSIPGFGGVLDVVDSPVMAAPVAYLLLR
jgi:phosphatidate cytidylyltransferase